MQYSYELCRLCTSRNLKSENFNGSNYLFIDRDSYMGWTQCHDLALCREALLINQISHMNSWFLSVLSSRNSWSFITFISRLVPERAKTFPTASWFFVSVYRASQHTQGLLYRGVKNFTFAPFLHARVRPKKTFRATNTVLDPFLTRNGDRHFEVLVALC